MKCKTNKPWDNENTSRNEIIVMSPVRANCCRISPKSKFQKYLSCHDGVTHRVERSTENSIETKKKEVFEKWMYGGIVDNEVKRQHRTLLMRSSINQLISSMSRVCVRVWIVPMRMEYYISRVYEQWSTRSTASSQSPKASKPTSRVFSLSSDQFIILNTTSLRHNSSNFWPLPSNSQRQ